MTMKRIAVLADIHCNLPALRAVLADVEREHVDAIVFGGDIVGGPLPAETLGVLGGLRRASRFVLGNGDRETVAFFDAPPGEPPEAGSPGYMAAFAATRIGLDARDLLAAFEPTVRLEVEGLGSVLFCHGTPRSDTEIVTTATSDERLRKVLNGVPGGVIVGGHTHRQFDRRLDEWRVINAGSVGIPYEGRVGAYWALLGPDVELRRTEYDVAAAIEEMRAGGFAQLDELLRESLIEPMDPDEVAALFERQATQKTTQGATDKATEDASET